MNNSTESAKGADALSSRAHAEPPMKAGSYTRAHLVETALRILDEFGLADLSMRRLAGVLEVAPSALYWHVPNKQTLLALVADQIISRAAPVDHADFVTNEAIDWKAVTLAEGRAIRDALLAYRDGAEVVSSTLALGLGAGEALARIRSGLDYVCGSVANGPAIAEVTGESLLFLILGQVWHQQQRMQADSLGVVSPEFGLQPGDAADAGVLAGAGLRVLPVQSDSLDFGIELILDGLEKRLATAP
jgi:TetR/AcrR family transcriptional regulator, tetracycline repressor protein